ncbi:uncharacterized protein LOC119575568 [Penaeus monodon]|uniref:uncharacterized protein LOC119575568 n=1 Tax=Penaeus monodon TaxID=6687 RepID=UPI0018A6F828|nr:uncharacterized protein LOC119575568 [Penaeus monodon]
MLSRSALWESAVPAKGQARDSTTATTRDNYGLEISQAEPPQECCESWLCSPGSRTAVLQPSHSGREGDHPPSGAVVASLENNAPVSRVAVLFKAGSRYETAPNKGRPHAEDQKTTTRNTGDQFEFMKDNVYKDQLGEVHIATETTKLVPHQARFPTRLCDINLTSLIVL